MSEGTNAERPEFPLTMTRSGDVHQDLTRLGSYFGQLSEIYNTSKGLDLADLLPALAVIVVELTEYPAGSDRDQRRESLLGLRMAIDRLYPSSVWPDSTMLIDGRFVWAIRERIAMNIRQIDEDGN